MKLNCTVNRKKTTMAPTMEIDFSRGDWWVNLLILLLNTWLTWKVRQQQKNDGRP